jgi:hypothetical protein
MIRVDMPRGRVLVALSIGAALTAAACFGGPAVPTAVDDTTATNEGTSVVIDVLANDSDLDDVPITVTVTASPNHGSAVVNADQTVTYTPDLDFDGEDGFVYQVCDTDGDCDTASVSVAVNDTPFAVADSLVTDIDTPISFRLRAFDQDIDPFDPTAHPLRFVITGGPLYGTVSGDLTAVIYEAPNTAHVELVYIPTAGFEGSDSITFSVTDPRGATSTAIIDIDVGKRPKIGALSGIWNTAVTLEEQTSSISAYSSTITARYRIHEFSFQGTATWTESGWGALTFVSGLLLDDTAKVRSTLAFLPQGPTFQYFRNVTEFSVFAIDFTHIFYFPGDPGLMYTQLVARFAVDGMSLTNTTKLVGSSLAFDWEEITASWSWAACNLHLDTTFLVTESGFDTFTVSLRDVPVFIPKDAGFGIYARLKTTFSTTSKEVIPSFKIELPRIGCFRVLVRLLATGNTLESVSIAGLKFEADLPGGITVSVNESLEAGRELISIIGPVQGCCGSLGTWNLVSEFALGDSAALFDWDVTSFMIDVPLTDHLKLLSEVTLQSISPHWSWRLECNLMW